MARFWIYQSPRGGSERLTSNEFVVVVVVVVAHDARQLRWDERQKWVVCVVEADIELCNGCNHSTAGVAVDAWIFLSLLVAVFVVVAAVVAVWRKA